MQARFSISDEERRSGALTPEHLEMAVRAFVESGFLWIERVFDHTFVQQLSKAYADRHCRLSPAELAETGVQVGNRRFMIPVSFEGPFSSETLYANPLILSILAKLLGQSLALQSLGSVLALPGSRDQHIHTDHPVLFESEELSGSLPPYAITCVVPLVDITPETGTTCFWEGSHHMPPSTNQKKSYDGAMKPFPRMGDIFLMDYRLKHGGTANGSEWPRPILYLVYSRSWFVDVANFQNQPRIRISRENYEKIPERHRQLFCQVSFPRDS